MWILLARSATFVRYPVMPMSFVSSTSCSLRSATRLEVQLCCRHDSLLLHQCSCSQHAHSACWNGSACVALRVTVAACRCRRCCSCRFLWQWAPLACRRISCIRCVVSVIVAPYTHTNTHTHIHTYTHTHTHMHTYTHTHIHNTHIHIHTYTHTIHTYTHIYTHTYIHTHTHTHTNTLAHACTPGITWPYWSYSQAHWLSTRSHARA